MVEKLSIRELRLVNFRSYHGAQFDFSERTVLVGANGAGKTNLLEALYLAATTKSFRADREVDMISWGETAGNVTLTAEDGGRRHDVSIGLSTGIRGAKKTFTVDHTKRKSRELVTLLPMVLFSADDIRLVGGAPGRRRRALDLTLSQSSRAYHEQLARYNRVLASRNRLLEQVAAGEATSDQLEFWDAELIASGQQIVTARQEFTDFLNARLSSIYQSIAGRVEKGCCQVAYQPVATDLATEIPRRRRQDLAVGTTTAGPHRDDWALLLGNRPLVSFGSGGEFRSAMLAFRLAEQAWLESRLEKIPALLLDDVFSELDELRRAALLATLPSGQTIITTPEASVLPGRYAKDAAVVMITPEGGGVHV